MFTNEVDSNRNTSTVMDLLAGLMAWIVIFKWLKEIAEAIRPAVKDAAVKGGMTVIDSVAKRIAE